MDKIETIEGKDSKLKDYAKELKTTIEKSHDAFEKQLNYISAGSLGLSIAIIEKVVKDLNLTVHNWILISSWSCFVLTLTSNLMSHLYASKVHTKTVNEIYNKNYSNSKRLKRDSIIGSWNFCSVTLLLLGLFFQLIFIAINITHY